MGRSSSSTSSGGGGGGGRYVAGSGSPDLPPGFRFHPTDEELVVHYLRNQALSRPCPVSIIPELNIYKFDPWELPARSDFGEGSEWYFFSPRDRKYPNGARPNRATASGYWKATGTDKAIYHDGRYVGVKKALVFYKGKPPRGAKSEWIMHEYRLGGAPGEMAAKMQQQPRKKGSMRLDDWVLCRIYQKKHQKRPEDELVPNYSSYDYLTPAAVPAVATPTAGEDSSCSYYLNAEASPPASVYDYEEPPPQQQRMPLFPTTPAIEHQQIQIQTQPQPQLQTQTLPLRFPRSCSLAHLLEAEYISMTQMMNDCSSADNFHAIASSLELEREADQFLHFDDDAAPALFQY